MRTLLRLTPDPRAPYTDSHQGRGADYAHEYETPPMRALMWQLERSVLAELLARTRARSVVDFACGTGRVTGLLAERLPDADVTGVDVAESMLEIAREEVPGVRFVHVDGRDLARVVPDGTVDLMTAFRFFANADAELRDGAAEAIAAAVRPGGYVLLNNHRNFWSPSYLARRVRPSAPAEGARNNDVLAPFLDRGFRVVARHSLGVLPQSDEQVYLLPDRVAPRFEWANLRRLSHRHTAGTNTVWLLQKD